MNIGLFHDLINLSNKLKHIDSNLLSVGDIMAADIFV